MEILIEKKPINILEEIKEKNLLIGKVTNEKIGALIENHPNKFSRDFFRFFKYNKRLEIMEELIKEYKKWRENKKIFEEILGEYFTNRDKDSTKLELKKSNEADFKLIIDGKSEIDIFFAVNEWEKAQIEIENKKRENFDNLFNSKNVSNFFKKQQIVFYINPMCFLRHRKGLVTNESDRMNVIDDSVMGSLLWKNLKEEITHSFPEKKENLNFISKDTNYSLYYKDILDSSKTIVESAIQRFEHSLRDVGSFGKVEQASRTVFKQAA